MIATVTSFCFLLLPDGLLLLLVSDFCAHHSKLSRLWHELANAVSSVKLQLHVSFGRPRFLVASCCPSCCSHIHVLLEFNLNGARKSSEEVHRSTIPSTTHLCKASPASLGSHDRHCQFQGHLWALHLSATHNAQWLRACCNKQRNMSNDCMFELDMDMDTVMTIHTSHCVLRGTFKHQQVVMA